MIEIRFQKALHVSELYTMRHVIDIQDYGGNRVARLLPTFRLHFDENHVHVKSEITLFIFFLDFSVEFRHNLNNPFVSNIVQRILSSILILIYLLFKFHSAHLLIMFVNY